MTSWPFYTKDGYKDFISTELSPPISRTLSPENMRVTNSCFYVINEVLPAFGLRYKKSISSMTRENVMDRRGGEE